MFTLRINGRAIAVTDAGEAEAHDLLSSSDFKEDLTSLESEGRPLWDGAAPLTIQRATDDEIETFQAAMEEDDEDGEDEPDEEGRDEDLANIVFLVSIDEDAEEDDPLSGSSDHRH